MYVNKRLDNIKRFYREKSYLYLHNF